MNFGSCTNSVTGGPPNTLVSYGITACANCATGTGNPYSGVSNASVTNSTGAAVWSIDTSIFCPVATSCSATLLVTIAGLSKTVVIPISYSCPSSQCTYLENIYVNLLSRNADFAGLEYWITNSAPVGSNSCAQIAVDFFNVAQAQSTLAGMSQSTFVNTIYQTLLSRAPDSAGYTYAINGLTAGTFTRSGWVTSVLQSAEFNTDCSSTYGYPGGAGTFSGLVSF